MYILWQVEWPTTCGFPCVDLKDHKLYLLYGKLVTKFDIHTPFRSDVMQKYRYTCAIGAFEL